MPSNDSSLVDNDLPRTLYKLNESTREDCGPEDNNTTRKQWSSCDFCRKRKKRCDANQKGTDSDRKCSRCLEYGVECTFAFISQKSVLQNARKRQVTAARQSRKLVSTESQQEVFPLPQSDFETMLEYTDRGQNGQNEAYIASLQAESFLPIVPLSQPEDLARFSASTFASGQRRLSEAEIDELLFEAPVSMPALSPDAGPIISSEGSTPRSPWQPYSELQMKMTHIASASGLSAELEMDMLLEFSVTGLRQLPVVDIDLIFVRYRFNLPTPLPKYLVLAMVACGASYSCQKSVPGIDREMAQLIFELAKQELIAAAKNELCIDIICALVLVSFHWQGDLTAMERKGLLELSVAKIQQLGLHKEFMLTHQRTRREAGSLRYLVWLNYIVDAFAPTVELMPGNSRDAPPPYQGKEIELDFATVSDLEFMWVDYLTGKPRNILPQEASKWHMAFHQSFCTLAKLHNKAINFQRLEYSIQHLIPELQAWTLANFERFNMLTTLLNWDDADEIARGMSFGITSMNFAYWYSALNIYFDQMKSGLDIDNYHMPAAGTPPAARQSLDEVNILGCFEAFNAMITLFERLAAGPRLFETAQLVRANLCYGGRILQIFYRNHVSYKGIRVVDELLLQRWETCLEISEVVWGPGPRGLDLSRISLEEVY